MFKVFNALILYIFIGGLLVTLDANHYFKKCNDFRPLEVATLIVFAWPISVPLNIFTSDELAEHVKSLPTCKQEPK